MTSPVAHPVDRAQALGDLEREVGVMIRRIRRIIHGRAQSLHPELQPATFLTLSWIVQHGPVRASAIAEAFCIDKGAVSRQTQHLIDLGLVDRTADPDDGRATLLSASESAVRRQEEVNRDARAALDVRLGDLSDAELADLARLLGRYNAALEE